jgi:Putative zinc-finger
MKGRGQFGDRPAEKPAHGSSGRLDCAAVELLWVEAAEGTLSAAVAEQVRAHTAECAACREKISQASRGREWLQILKQEPLIPPSDLVAKILARTAGSTEAGAHFPGRTTRKVPTEPEEGFAQRFRLPGYASPDSHIVPIAAESIDEEGGLGREGATAGLSAAMWHRPSVVLLRKTVFEPRIALVAAMAFFSISMTLNLMGVRLTSFRAADLQPQAMRRAVTRQYAQANARLVHYYENLRIVYEVEARVHQLRQAADSGSPAKPGYSQGKSGSGADSSGQAPQEDRGNQSSRKGLHRERMEVIPVTDRNGERNHSVPAEPEPIAVGPVIDVSFHARPVEPRLSVLDNVQPRAVSTPRSGFETLPASQGSSYWLPMTHFSAQERNSA